MKYLTYITGETCQGKSFIANYFKGRVFRLDEMYLAYNRARQVKIDQSYFETWGQYEDLEDYKKRYLEQKLAKARRNLVIEGVSCAVESERKLIEDIFKPDYTVMFWIQNKRQIENYKRRFKTLDGLIEKNESFVKHFKPLLNTYTINL